MIRILTLGVVAILATTAALAFAVGSGAAGSATCQPGVRMVDGSPARVFCGPATATVHSGAKTFSFGNGKCEESRGGYVVNLGTFFASSSHSKRPYFGLLISKPKPGTYKRQQLAYRFNGVTHAIFASVTLKSLRAGTFFGDEGGRHIKGSFAC